MYQFFGSGFSIAAGNGNKWNIKLLAMIFCQLLQCFQNICYQLVFVISRLQHLHQQWHTMPRLQRLQGKQVAIKIWARQGKKNSPAFNFLVSVCTDGCCR